MYTRTWWLTALRLNPAWVCLDIFDVYWIQYVCIRWHVAPVSIPDRRIVPAKSKKVKKSIRCVSKKYANLIFFFFRYKHACMYICITLDNSWNTYLYSNEMEKQKLKYRSTRLKKRKTLTMNSIDVTYIIEGWDTIIFPSYNVYVWSVFDSDLPFSVSMAMPFWHT